MKTNNQENTFKNVQGLVVNPQIYLNNERQVLVHRLSDDLKIEMPINLYRKILGIPFTKIEPSNTAARRSVFGLIARPSIYLSRDGQYLIHRVLGISISKHANYYKRILNAEADSATQKKAM
ncbi:MAG: hypothetical protein AB7F59_12720 [Bdellovibrionales bacterium]